MLNMSLIKPRNLIVITAIAILSHVVAKPLYSAVDKTGDN